MNSMCRIVLFSSGVLAAGMMMGASCVVPAPDSGPAVLAGDWESADDTGEPVVVRFDDQGVVDAILVGTGSGETATILVEGASTVLEGSTVTIVVPTPGGDATFVGTLAEDQNTMTGTVDRMIDVGDQLVVIIPQGDVTLTRVPADQDGDEDGVADDADNCPIDANAEQGDVDDDGVGDVCDNCPADANPDQSDVDADGEGDVCEPAVDSDGDGVTDDVDNCPDDANADQSDVDADGIGDVCDAA